MNEMKKTGTEAADLEILQDLIADIVARKSVDAEHAKRMGDSTARDILDELEAAAVDALGETGCPESK